MMKNKNIKNSNLLSSLKLIEEHEELLIFTLIVLERSLLSKEDKDKLLDMVRKQEELFIRYMNGLKENSEEKSLLLFEEYSKATINFLNTLKFMYERFEIAFTFPSNPQNNPPC